MGAFDDLIPAKGGNAKNPFADLLPKEKTFGQKALEVISSGHISFDKEPEPEVSFTKEGEMTAPFATKKKSGSVDPIGAVPSGDPGFLSDPVTWAGAVGVKGAMTAGGIAKRLIASGIEAAGWASGGVTDAPAIVKGGVKGLVKGLEAKNAAKIVAERQSKGNVFADLVPDSPTMSADNVASVVADTANVAPKTVGAFDDLVPEQSGLDTLAAEQKMASQAGKVSFAKKSEPKLDSFGNPDIEARFNGADGVQNPSRMQRFKDGVIHIKNLGTREYEFLPRNKENAPLIFELKKLEKQKEVADDTALRMVGEITSTLDKESYNVFRRKVVLDDLEGEVGQSRYLPYGFTPETFAVEKQRFDALAGSNPKIAEALQKRKEMWGTLRDEYIKAMDEVGVDVSHIKENENYFRHQVLQYAQDQGLYGTGKKLRTPSNASYLKQRGMKEGADLGAQYDINSNYIQVEHQVMAQMFADMQKVKAIKNIKAKYDISDTLKKGEIPKGYTTWQPREGNVFYMVDTVPAKVMRSIQEGMLTDAAEIPGHVTQSLAMGGKRKEWVVKEEVAKTLDNITKDNKEEFYTAFSRESMSLWKEWQLVSPRRYFKYNVRNLSGDFEAMFIGNPSAIKETIPAFKELVDVAYRKKAMSKDMQEWFDRGGMSSTLQANEMNGMKNSWMFNRLYETSGKEIPERAFKGYWNTVRKSTDVREAVGRYAAYKDYKRQMIKNGGKPNNFGASDPEQIMSLGSIEDRAYALSNELMGAYDRTSALGQAFSRHIFPFWRFQEVNLKRNIQFMRNAVNDDRAMEMLGRTLGAKTPLMAIRMGKVGLKMSALASSLFAYNNYYYKEEEKQLSPEVRAMPHIILPTGVDWSGQFPGLVSKTADGKVQYFSRLGIMGDFLQWFGLDTGTREFRKWLNGDQTAKETLLNFVKNAPLDPIKKLWGGSIPITKLGFEEVMRQSTYPDPFKRGTIRDRAEYAARSVGLENEYKALWNIPSAGYGKSLKNIFMYESDPREVAYRNIYDKKREFLDKAGKGAEGFWLTARGMALWEYRRALRYNDRDAKISAIRDYREAGGQLENIPKSLENMNPLSGMSQEEVGAFVKGLDTEEKKQLGLANQFYTQELLHQK